MGRLPSRAVRLASFVFATLGTSELYAQTQQTALFSSFHTAQQFAFQLPARHHLLDTLLGGVAQPQPVSGGGLDLQPLLGEVTGFLRAHGFPLHEDPQLAGQRGIVFSAAWNVANELPALEFHIGNQGPFDAFYANDQGFRWSLMLPLMTASRLALHLGGGENSEFGNWGIIGLQWQSQHRPIAIGVGVAVAPSNAHGLGGMVCQMRMRLD